MDQKVYKIQYKSKLSLLQTQEAIKFVKDTFQKKFAKKLNLLRVSAPLFVLKNSGLNDNLSGKEEPISFTMKNIDEPIEIVHSLAKWKRIALKKYNIKSESGLYTDMNAIRKDEDTDFIHSIYVDQWDWERVIENKDRKLSYLKKIVNKIYNVIYSLSIEVNKKYPVLDNKLVDKVHFVSTNELEQMYPSLSRKEREDAITRKYKAVFLYKIGHKLLDGHPHDSRAADYDDWNLNGDLLIYYEMYDMALEISSMGIRVDKKSLLVQLKEKDELFKMNNDYCLSILNEDVPLTIGGGIGQSRLCMLLLQKAHIGEVQASIWRKEEIDKLKQNNIELL